MQQYGICNAMITTDFFFYVSDDQGRGIPLVTDHNTVTFTIERHYQLFGNILTWLRSTALENSATRSDSREVGIIGSHPIGKCATFKNDS
jgi:hypothetical protein